MKTKICSKCGIEKDITGFYKCKGNKDDCHVWCKECIKRYDKKYRQEHKQQLKEYDKKRYQENKIEKRQRNKKYQQYHKNQRNKYERERRKIDMNYKLVDNLRSRIKDGLKRNPKFAKTMELLDCSIPELKQHLQKHFKQGMNWNNHSRRGWHIDHIRPCCSFDLSKPNEQRKCFNYKNLQPLWAEENMKKGGKIDGNYR